MTVVEDGAERDFLAHDCGRESLGDLLPDRERVAEDPARVLDRCL